MIYDGDQKRVLAARDRVGSQEMHWGVTDDGRFMFGSEDIDLKDCNPTATPFPSGDCSFDPCLASHIPLCHTGCPMHAGILGAVYPLAPQMWLQTALDLCW